MHACSGHNTCGFYNTNKPLLMKKYKSFSATQRCPTRPQASLAFVLRDHALVAPSLAYVLAVHVLITSWA